MFMGAGSAGVQLCRPWAAGFTCDLTRSINLLFVKIRGQIIQWFFVVVAKFFSAHESARIEHEFKKTGGAIQPLVKTGEKEIVRQFFSDDQG